MKRSSIANKTGEPQSVPQMQPGGRVTLIDRTLRYLVQCPEFVISTSRGRSRPAQIIPRSMGLRSSRPCKSSLG